MLTVNCLEGKPLFVSRAAQFVIGHHPVFGAISANGYNATALYSADASSTDLGRKDASGGASWASVRPGAA